MPRPNEISDSHDPRLDRILSEYLEAVEAGQAPSPADWLARYPEFADELSEFFSARESLDRLVAATPLPQTHHSGGNELTLASAAGEPTSTPQLSSRLRYFGDYELLAEIARGGMGVVYRARQVSLNRSVAVKMILSGELAAPEDIARFRAEAEAAANLDHPRIVPIYEIGQWNGQHYFSMKFIDGESLGQRIAKRSLDRIDVPRTPDEDELRRGVQLLAQVARAVHYAHQRGIIHRDLKPANVLIDSQNQPHITDFGLAKRVSGDSELTRTGAIVGTPSYMAPEQAGGNAKTITTAADIYGLGAMLYATLTGRAPFDGPNPLDTLLKVRSEPPVPPSRLVPGLDRDLEIVCLKCLEKEPDARYRSAGELTDDLERWLRGEPISAAPPNLANLFWRWFAANLRAAVCVLAIGVLVGAMVCEVPIANLRHNLGSHLPYYRHQFPAHEPPWVLQTIAAYPVWLSVVAFPFWLLGYFSLGWLTDWLVRPKDATAALLCGLGVGSTAAVTAFLVAIGWQTMNQVAIWPSIPDMELLAATLDKDTLFSDGRTVSDAYPQADSARWVIKKIQADMQSRIPEALFIGLMFSIGLLLLPGTLQTISAQLLRARGDSLFWRIIQYLELSLSTSLMLVVGGFSFWDAPWIALSTVALPAGGLLALAAVRRASRWIRQAVLLLVILGSAAIIVALCQYWFAPVHQGGGMSLGLAIVGASLAACGVTLRWAWWSRLMLFSLWILTWNFCTQHAIYGDFTVTGLAGSIVGSVALILLACLIGWWHSQRAPQ